MKRTLAAALALAIAAPASLAAQTDIDNVCDEFSGNANLQSRCASVAQAVDAAQPQLGILMAGGNPTLGTASTGGVRLGILPRVSAGLRLNVVFARLPDIREEDSANGEVSPDKFSVPAPALGANVSVGVFPGISVAPMVGGFGAIDLLGSATVLPVSLAGVDGLEKNPVSWGAGARIGLLRESFITPGVSVSVMYRRMGDIQFGDVCEGDEGPAVGGSDASCTGEGDFGEIDFGLSNVSTRAAVSKRLLGFGLTAGVGYDRFETDANLAFRAPSVTGNTARPVYRFSDVQVDNDRWSAFLNGSFTLLVGSIVAEAGWMQGQEPISGFPARSDFDPKEGTFFGSIGARLSL
ncbi:MAG: hypothetical protein ICV87_07500 [Gemmatimonadetes bacterium]|nr:hypothetical protein [Gemmatimonadota bacterium]